MSRKKTEKSNLLRIGIFTDKSATYNLDILEILNTLNKATAWQIAKKIQEKQRHEMNKDVETQTRRIYSVIQRKNGRLLDLERKGYIIHDEQGLWELTRKGTWALQIKTGNQIKHEDMREESEKLLKSIQKIPDDIIEAPLGISIDRSKFKSDSKRLCDLLTKNPSLSKTFFEEMKMLLIEKNMDLDVFAPDELLSILIHRKHMKAILTDMAKSLGMKNQVLLTSHGMGIGVNCRGMAITERFR